MTIKRSITRWSLSINIKAAILLSMRWSKDLEPSSKLSPPPLWWKWSRVSPSRVNHPHLALGTWAKLRKGLQEAVLALAPVSDRKQRLLCPPPRVASGRPISASMLAQNQSRSRAKHLRAPWISWSKSKWLTWSDERCSAQANLLHISSRK